MGRAPRVLFVLVAATATAGADQKPDGQALYAKAAAAADAGNYEEATDLVMLSVAQPGKHKAAGRLLYADILARKGDLQRARDFYEGLRLSADPSTKAIIDQRIAALDQQSCTPLTRRTFKQTKNTVTYEEAYAAFEAHDYARALQLAQKVATGGGPRVMDGKLLYADAIFQMGDYQRAKAFYIGLHQRAGTAHRSAIGKRVAAVNRKLQLPDADGL